MGKQVETLKHHANLAANLFELFHIAIYFTPANMNGSLLMVFKLVDAADHRGFTRSRWAADNNTLALFNR